MSYEVYIDVRHHPKHNDENEKVERAAFKMADTDNPLATVAACLRMFADELDPVSPPDSTEAQVHDLRVALEMYGTHKPECTYRWNYEGQNLRCSCGYHAALAASPPSPQLAETLREALRAEIAMADLSVETLKDLHANWERIVEEHDPDGGPLIENILYWLIEGVTPSAEARALASVAVGQPENTEEAR